jgi:hypothetical protein
MTETANESGDRAAQVRAICARFSNDRHRMLDILLQVQERFRHVSEADMDAIAQATGITRIEVEGTASFYAFLSREPKGEITIRLCDDIVDRFSGLAEVQAVFERLRSGASGFHGAGADRRRWRHGGAGFTSAGSAPRGERGRASCSAMPTKASRAPSRTVCF